MVPPEVHEQVIAERDYWEALARERRGALEKLKADLSAEMIARDRLVALEKRQMGLGAETVRTAARIIQLASILMILMVVFAGACVATRVLRETARECPPRLERP